MGNGNGYPLRSPNGSGGSPLSSLAGARVRLEERITFESASLQEAMETIRKLGGTGALTISFLNGSPAGTAEWKTSRKQNT